VHDQRVGKATGKAVDATLFNELFNQQLLDKLVARTLLSSDIPLSKYIPAGDVAKPKNTVRYIRDFERVALGRRREESWRESERREEGYGRSQTLRVDAARCCEIRKLLS
jgi:hypothetical protein